jgi:hypothetical protein
VQAQTATEMAVTSLGIQTVGTPTNMSANVARSRADYLQSVITACGTHGFMT